MTKEDNKYFCIFGGGAIRGLAYAGVVRALREKNIEVTGFAGASAGSIAATMYALDYKDDEISEVFNKFNYTLFKDLNFSFKIELAISKGEVFTDRIREIIAKKIPSDKPVTFRDFPNNLYILTSNITTGKCVIFSKETTPDFEVAQAVRISAGFPGLMNPYELNGELYVDGDLIKPYALSQISDLINPKDTRILEFRLEGSKYQPPPKNPLEFMNYAVDFISSASTDNVLALYAKKDKYDFIPVETKDTLLFDFTISNEKKQAVIDLGYEVTKKFFEQTLPEKKKHLLKEYKEMKRATKKTLNAVINRDYKKGKAVLNEYICENYAEFTNLDENVVKVLDHTAKTLNKGEEKILFLIPRFNNHSLVKENLKILNSILDKKINGIEEFLSDNK